MLAAIYLGFQALLYVALAAWCTLAPDGTSKALGFGLTNGSARSEYITVYGGLELGMGIFFLLTALNPDWRRMGVLFALCTYGCLALFRLGTLIFVPDVGTFPKLMIGLEATMAVLAALLFFGARE
jgi:hypothetical protein